MKKKIIITVISLLLVAGILLSAYFVWKGKKEKSAEGLCYVESVSVITGNGMTWNNRFMGIVETQEITKVTKDSDKVVKEIFVKEEDEVKAGDKLFEYDTEEMTLKVRQLELELSSYYNNISTMYSQIETLDAERELAPADQKIEYTSQIQNLQAQINQVSYDASAKQLEIDRQYAAINNSVVFAPVDGVVSSINDQESQEDPYANEYYGMGNGDSDAFISIMAMGDFRIKGSVSELNAYSLYEGMPVIVRSRIDDSVMWTGTISKVDLEHPEGNEDMYYYNPGETATKYPFYVQVDDSEGMMLGQHMYIELDYGQGAMKEGMWLYESYIVVEDSNTGFVWAEGKDGKLEKREVKLGEYDSDMMMYEIVAGLSNSDYIAFPEENLKEGMKTTHNYEDISFDEDLNIENMDTQEDIIGYVPLCEEA
ncbi:MAG: efflux RND transporter periplasmic adaptor subunit [Lachnospiraceae bacterium]|nr:efflux RND transporter periplasmic adaptor subunit [Lachnospiraceae bacterium]